MALVGTFWLIYAAAYDSAATWLIPALVTLVGAAALIGALGWLAWRTLRMRRHLPPSRYRGPGVILLFVLALAAGNFVALVPLIWDVLAGGDVTAPGPLTTTGLLLITPLALAAVAWLFVLRPRALAGIRLTDGPRTTLNVLRGVALGAVAWVAAALIGAALTSLVTALTGETPTEDQTVALLGASLPPIVAIGLIGILAPFAEELFFRGVAANAWEREHGRRRALYGSAALFAVAHLFGGSLLVLPSILLLGLLFGWVYLSTRSLPLVVGSHATFNCLSLAVLFLVGS